MITSLGVLLPLLGAAHPLPQDAASLRRGRAIYRTGESPRAETIAAEIIGGETVPARQLPCLQCHRADGSGGIEAGILAPDIRFSRLGSRHGIFQGGIVKPPYTRDTLRQALVDGVASHGGSLDPLMPRYHMGDEDLSDLLDYLKVLGSEPAPGTTSTEIRIATLLPLTGPSAAQGRAIARLLGRFFQEVASQGGVHGRRIALQVVDITEDALKSARRLALGSSLADECFAVLASGGDGASADVLDLLVGSGIPVVGPLSFPLEDPSRGPIFHVLPSFEDQGRAVAQHLWRERPSARIAIAPIDSGEAGRRMKDAFARVCCERRLDVVVEAQPSLDEQSFVLLCRREQADVVACFGSAALAKSLVDALQRAGLAPAILASQLILSARGTWPGFPSIVVAPSFGPQDDRGLAAFARLGEGEELTEMTALQMAAYAAASCLLEGMKAAGRDLTREGLVSALEALRRHETGVLPPLTFGARRRLGTRQATILTYDQGGRRVGIDSVEER